MLTALIFTVVWTHYNHWTYGLPKSWKTQEFSVGRKCLRSCLIQQEKTKSSSPHKTRYTQNRNYIETYQNINGNYQINVILPFYESHIFHNETSYITTVLKVKTVMIVLREYTLTTPFFYLLWNLCTWITHTTSRYLAVSAL